MQLCLNICICAAKKKQSMFQKLQETSGYADCITYDAGVTDIVREVVREETGQMDALHLINH